MTLPAHSTASLTIAQVAQRLGVHPKAVYRLVETGRLPATKVDGRWQVPCDALSRFEQGDARSAPARPAAPLPAGAAEPASEERLRVAAQVAGFGLYDDRGPGQVYWSPELKTLFGLPPDAQPDDGPRAALERIHPDDRPRWMAALAAARDPNGSGEIAVEHRVVRPDGSILWVAQQGRILFEGEGPSRRGVRAIGVVVDITARKATEAALNASREELQTILSSVADGITVQGADGAMSYANDAAARLIGLPSADVLLAAPQEEVLSRFRVYDERGTLLAQDQLPGATARRTGQPVDAVLRYQVIATGAEHWSHVRAVPVFDDAGDLRFIVTAFQDITALKQVDVLQHRLAAIVASSTDAIVSKTLDGIVTSWNASAERIFGYTAEEMIGQPILRLIPPERHNEEDYILARLRAGERVEHFETVRMTKDGRQLDVSLTISPVRDGSGAIIGASKIARDITAQKQAEAEREQLLAHEQAALVAAQQALAVRDEFLASVSHDLRTPLTSIRGLAQLLARRVGRLDLPEGLRVVESATAIDRAAGTMAAMVDELLDLTRLEAGQPLELRREAVDLVALARAATETQSPSAPAHDLRVVAAVPALVGQWDGRRLERVLGNLLSNAVKYSPAGGTIEVHVRPAEQAGGAWAELTVTDQGIGIPAADLPFIFERFRRGANVTGRVGGAGLGLAGARSIVEYHGGTITAASDEGAGTTVTVRLPLTPIESPTDALSGMESA